MLILQITKAILDNYSSGIQYFQKFEVEIKDEIIIQLCSIFRFMTHTRTNKPPPEISYFPFTRKDVFKCLIRLAYSGNISFLSRIRCCEQIDNMDMSKPVLKSVLDLNLPDVLEKDVKFDYWYNHFILFFMDEDEKDVIEMFEKLVTTNTIARGVNIYRSIQFLGMYQLSQHKIPGVSMSMSLSDRIPKPNLIKGGLDAYFFRNREQVRNYLIPTLQIYKRKGWLKEEHCRIAQELVEGDQTLTFDLADFFVTLLGNEFRDFFQWGQQHIRGVRVEGNVNNFFTGAQSVHQLDQNRTKFVEWLEFKSENFALDEKLTEGERDTEELKIIERENRNYRDLLQNIEWSSRRSEKIYRSLERMTTDNTRIKSVNNPDQKWSHQDIYSRILFVIANHSQKENLIIRLNEELEEMSGTCFSGHLNRLFNVFCGIEEGLVIVDVYSEIKKNIKVELQGIIDNAPEETQDKILDLLGSEEGWNNDILNFIKFEAQRMEERQIENYVIKNKVLRLDEFQDLFKQVVNSYFGTEIYL